MEGLATMYVIVAGGVFGAAQFEGETIVASLLAALFWPLVLARVFWTRWRG